MDPEHSSPRKLFDHERFRNMAGGVQSLVTAAALLVAGGWAVTRLSLLVEPQIARADLLLKQNAAQRAPAVRVALSARLERIPTTSSRGVVAAITLTNEGTDSVRIDLSGSAPLRIGKGLPDRVGYPILASSPVWMVGDTLAAGYIYLSRDGAIHLEAFLPLDGPGIYLVDFRAPVSLLPGVPGHDIYGSTIVVAADK